MTLRRTTWWRRPVTLAVAAACCLMVLATASCGARADVTARPASTSTLPAVSTGVDASVGGSDPASVASAIPVERARGGDVMRWRQVLERLDRVRSRAFERLHPVLLTRVYLRGSAVLRHERAVLDEYRDRGVRLLGVRLRLEKVWLMSAARNQVTVRVVERLGPTRAVLGSRRVRLPVDAPTSRVLRLVRGEAGWRIAAARRVSG